MKKEFKTFDVMTAADKVIDEFHKHYESELSFLSSRFLKGLMYKMSVINAVKSQKMTIAVLACYGINSEFENAILNYLENQMNPK